METNKSRAKYTLSFYVYTLPFSNGPYKICHAPPISTNFPLTYDSLIQPN